MIIAIIIIIITTITTNTAAADTDATTNATATTDRIYGMDFYEKVKELHDYVLFSTRRHLVEYRIVIAAVADDDDATTNNATNNNATTNNKAVENALDDTTGWRSLETGILAASGRSLDYIHDIVKRCSSSSQTSSSQTETLEEN